ncbi:MAG: hypothetical protein KBH85_05270 [Lachnospiraceae bacterium]|nr:hypothetical protein [Lachnospiraceae bacterium]
MPTLNSLNDISQEMGKLSDQNSAELDSTMLYHYTSASALRKILRPEGIVLRFTKYGFVNDTSEGKVITDMYRIACEKLLRENKITREFFIAISNLDISTEKHFYVPDNSGNGSLGKVVSDEYDAYICCFSTLQDSLPMWNYYIKDESGAGYNIEMTGVLRNGLYRIDGLNSYNWGICKIDYVDVDNDDDNIFYRWIQELARYSDNIDTVRKILSHYMMRAQLMYKHSCFKHEHEVRFVLYLPRHLARSPKIRIDYTEKKGLIIPYIDMTIPVKEIAKSITVGALVHFDDARDGIATLLAERGYPIGEEDVRSSRMPVRF